MPKDASRRTCRALLPHHAPDRGPRATARFVFDGAPRAEGARTRAPARRQEALRRGPGGGRARGDLAEAYSKATMTSRLTREMVAEASELLRLMGMPTVQAPSEGEAQAAHMARAGGVGRREQGLRFAAVRRAALVRFLTISGKEFLPSPGSSGRSCPRSSSSSAARRWGSRASARRPRHSRRYRLQPRIKGIGPKKALALVQRHGRSKRCRRRSARVWRRRDFDEVRRYLPGT